MPRGPARVPGRPVTAAEQLAGGWPAADRRALMAKAAYAVGARRALLGVLLAAVGLPLLTALLVVARPDLSLTDDLLIYLVAVVALAVIGGFWPAVLAAASASLLLNWYFTPPLHTFTIDKPDNLLALLLFVTVAVAVSSVVHLAASRAGQAARSREEARLLLALAQTVLGGADTPAAVLDHLVQTLGGRAELLENVSGRWVRIAASGSAAGRGRRHPRRRAQRPGARGERPAEPHRAGAAGRLRGAGRRRARPGAAAHPGRPGGGAGRGQPDADRAARRGQPRPAHAAGLDQGQRRAACARPTSPGPSPTRRRCSPRSRRTRTGSTG